MTKAYPVIFSAPMIRALLDRSKQQTRRLAWRCLKNVDGEDRWYPSPWQRRYEKFQAGERPWLWTRETWATVNAECGPGWAYRANGEFIQPEYDGENFGAGPSFNYDKYPGEYCMWYGDLIRGAPDHRWTPSIHQPKWASRISLRVTDMKKEMLQDISEEDARAEGVTDGAHDVDCSYQGDYPADEYCPQGCGSRSYQEVFARLWESIHGPGSWNRNDEIVATTFEVHQRNIEDVAA